jgi:D-hexose-6-phosphate mutarotase
MREMPVPLPTFSIPGHLAFEQSPLGGPIARLRHRNTEALVALHGGQVLNWTIDGRGLLWLSPIARIRDGKGIRGGIPVCWPWFGDHSVDPAKPAHGFVRHRAWSVAATDATADAVSIILTTATTDADLSLWPHAAEIRLTITLSETLSLALETHNTGSASFPLTQALHTYFRISDIANAGITGLEDRDYLDKLDAFSRKVQSGPIGIAAEIDRIYLGDTASITLSDGGTGRRIHISASGSRSAVVWNPWVEKTARLGDMGSPDAFRQMLCIETANAGDDIVLLAPGNRHVLGVTYSPS